MPSTNLSLTGFHPTGYPYRQEHISFGQDVGKESYGVRMAMRAQTWVEQAVNAGHPTPTIIEGFKKLESNFFKSMNG